ncbi:MAG: DNA-binding protein [Spirochaetae bacterium HGW-Spirochaetae-2]|nr:MAG: DNA-binding protein [Spirochaetae bacterium HGW-Spirochaetae-2]
MTKLLTLDEAVALLQVSKPTLYRLTSQRKIPFIKIGGSIRFNEVKLIQWIDERTVVPGESYGRETI